LSNSKAFFGYSVFWQVTCPAAAAQYYVMIGNVMTLKMKPLANSTYVSSNVREHHE